MRAALATIAAASLIGTIAGFAGPGWSDEEDYHFSYRIDLRQICPDISLDCNLGNRSMHSTTDDAGNVHLMMGDERYKFDPSGHLVARLDFSKWQRGVWPIALQVPGDVSPEPTWEWTDLCDVVGPDGNIYVQERGAYTTDQSFTCTTWVVKVDYSGQALGRWRLQEVPGYLVQEGIFVHGSGEISASLAAYGSPLDRCGVRFASDGRVVAFGKDARADLDCLYLARSHYLAQDGTSLIVDSPGRGQRDHVLFHAPDGSLQGDSLIPEVRYPDRRGDWVCKASLIGMDDARRLYFNAGLSVDVYVPD